MNTDQFGSSSVTTPARQARLVRLHHVLVAMPLASIFAQKAGYAGAAEVLLWAGFAVFGLVVATAFLVSHTTLRELGAAAKAKLRLRK